MNPPNQIIHQRSTPTVFPHKPSSHNASTTTASNSWYYPDKPAPPISTSAPMIGPPSTFYNPEDVSQQLRDSHAQQYQQWIDMFGNQQQQQRSTYDAAQHRGYHQMQTQFNFVAGQYTPPPSLSAYAESASGDTVTQSNMGGATGVPDEYGAPGRSGEGYQPYYDLLAATVGAPSSSVAPQSQSYHPRTAPESTAHSYPEAANSAYQQQQQQPAHSHSQQQQPQHPHTQPHQQQPQQPHTQPHQQPQPQRPIQPHQQQQPPPQRPIQQAPPTNGRQQHLTPPQARHYSSGSNTQSTHSSSLSPPSVSWSDDPNYPNAHPSPPPPNGRGTYAQQQQQQNGAHQQQQNGAHLKRPAGTTDSSPRDSPPGGSNSHLGGSSHQNQPQPQQKATQSHSHHLLVGPSPPQQPAKPGGKRKRVKRNPVEEDEDSPPQMQIVSWNQNESDSEDEDDEDDAGFFDGGGIGVGLGGLGVVSRGKRGRGGRSRL